MGAGALPSSALKSLPCIKLRMTSSPLLLTQVDGVNLLRIPARDAYAYGRRLLDVLFTKIEQRASILLTFKKTNKPALDQQRVHKLFGEFCSFFSVFFPGTAWKWLFKAAATQYVTSVTGCMDRRYHGGYDHKTLVASLNQKCRDAKEQWLQNLTINYSIIMTIIV